MSPFDPLTLRCVTHSSSASAFMASSVIPPASSFEMPYSSTMAKISSQSLRVCGPRAREAILLPIDRVERRPGTQEDRRRARIGRGLCDARREFRPILETIGVRHHLARVDDRQFGERVSEAYHAGMRCRTLSGS